VRLEIIVQLKGIKQSLRKRNVEVTNYIETEWQCASEGVTLMRSSDVRKERRDFGFLFSGEECNLERLFGDFSKKEYNSDKPEIGELCKAADSRGLKPGL
jgi:hypothetical protein